MTNVRAAALAVIVVLGLVSSGTLVGAVAPLAQDQPAAGLAPEALAQIAALLADKEARTGAEQKIDSQLLYEAKMESGAPIADGILTIQTDMPYAGDGHIVVDVRARAGSGVAERLAAAGVEVESVSADGASLRAHVNIADVEAIAADDDVVFVEPRQDAMVSQAATTVLIDPNLPPTGQGSRSSEGDVTHRAFAARGAYHIDGSGLKIGVLSDGVRTLAASQASGDLGQVTVIGPAAPCAATTTCDEGTAMLEIVHDLVPGAQLYFASAFVSITSFADNIRALRAAGCDIIVDDVFYFVETPFQDGQPGPTNRNGGVVIQAVNDVTADGALYFSSAGNSGNLNDGTAGVWEGNFVDGGAVTGQIRVIEGAAARLHSFGGQSFNVLTSVGSVNNLHWSDPLGASSNDYDLFRVNAAGTTVLAASVNPQTGTQDPYEQVSAGAAGDRLVVVKFSGADRYLHVNSNRGRLSVATAGQTHGHAAAANAYGVAATPAGAAFPFAFTSTDSVETFSSDGPRRIFFQANGTPYTPGDFSATGGIVRQKPDVTAADGVSVTGVGGFPSTFFGTSAAAPHAAAIAALVKSANPALSPAQIRGILTSTAIDIEGAGVDRDAGAGILSARDAVAATGKAGDAFLTVESIDVSDNPGNGNGVPEAGEGARIAIALKNNGGATATAISALIASPSNGVTLALPTTATYPDLASAASATRTELFTTGADFGCPSAASFAFTANYAGGVGASPLSAPFTVPVGITSFSITRRLDGTAPPSFPGIVGATGTQNVRLNRQDTASVCGALKTPPPISTAAGQGARQFDAYRFTTCANSTPSCASVTFGGPNSINMFTAAYAPSFNPADIRQNYKADPAVSSSGPLTYSFDLPAGSSTFAIDVHDVPVLAAPSNSQYTLTVSNACLGACEPPNHPPIARAKNVTVAADTMCVANASIDNGSSDPDGDPLTFVQAPAGPYPLGTTANVLMTVTDPQGAFSQASGDVTVVDETGPTIAGLATVPAVLWPPNHKLVDVTVNFTSADNCSEGSCVLTVASNQPKDDDEADDVDAIVVDAHHVRLRAERHGGGARVYTLTLTCTDAAGNTTVRTTTVVVPHDQSDKDKKGI
jgi:subtilase family protein